MDNPEFLRLLGERLRARGELADADRCDSIASKIEHLAARMRSACDQLDEAIAMAPRGPLYAGELEAPRDVVIEIED